MDEWTGVQFYVRAVVAKGPERSLWEQRARRRLQLQLRLFELLFPVHRRQPSLYRLLQCLDLRRPIAHTGAGGDEVIAWGRSQ